MTGTVPQTWDYESKLVIVGSGEIGRMADPGGPTNTDGD